MIPTHRISTHPGAVLLREFLEPMKLSEEALAVHLGVPVERIQTLVREESAMLPDLAWLLSDALGISPEFWMSLQAKYDLCINRPSVHIQPLPTNPEIEAVWVKEADAR